MQHHQQKYWLQIANSVHLEHDNLLHKDQMNPTQSSMGFHTNDFDQITQYQRQWWPNQNIQLLITNYFYTEHLQSQLHYLMLWFIHFHPMLSSLPIENTQIIHLNIRNIHHNLPKLGHSKVAYHYCYIPDIDFQPFETMKIYNPHLYKDPKMY